MHRAEFLDLEPLQITSFLKDLFPPEAEVRGSNPLGRANHRKHQLSINAGEPLILTAIYPFD